MFQYPKQAEFNRVVPKSKIYAFGRPTRALKDRFVSEIHEIVWKYKLSPETVNLPARHGIEEIQVFAVALKTEEIGEPLLRTIDRAIPSPIIYQLTFQNLVRFAAAYKRPNDAATGKHVIEAYFMTTWQPATEQLQPVPVVLDLAAFYEEILVRIIPLPRRPGESLAALVERVLQFRTAEREFAELNVRLRKEPQFNRKVEINAAIRANKTQLAQLSAP